MRPPALLALLLLSLACAAPLIGTGASVAEGGFCRAHGCALVAREVIAPDLLDKVSHTYRLQRGGSLLVLRDHERHIERATLQGVPLTGPVARDFTRAFAGVAFEPAAVRACVTRATAAGYVLASGRVSGTPYRVSCYTYAGRVQLLIERA